MWKITCTFIWISMRNKIKHSELSAVTAFQMFWQILMIPAPSVADSRLYIKCRLLFFFFQISSSLEKRCRRFSNESDELTCMRVCKWVSAFVFVCMNHKRNLTKTVTTFKTAALTVAFKCFRLCLCVFIIFTAYIWCEYSRDYREGVSVFLYFSRYATVSETTQ